MSRILVRQLLTNEEYNSALIKGVSVFLYNEINFIPEPKKGITLQNCTKERVLSTWFTWQKNKEVFINFKNKYPQFFVWDKYDMSLAFIKALYWSNQKTGFLQYVKNRDFSNLKVLKEDNLFDSNYLHVFLKYYYSLFKHKSIYNKFIQIDKKEKIGLLITSEFEIILYKNIITKIIKNKNVLFFVLGNNVNDELVKLGVKQNQIIFCNNLNQKKIPFINYFSLNKESRFILNQIVNNWEEVERWIGVAETIASYGIYKVLINEAENGLFGAVLGEVFQKHGVYTYNTMNGMKAGQVQDAFINFDFWFVWDEQMKFLLKDKNKLPEKMLLVSGHLMEDEVNQNLYQGTFNKIDLNNKWVISLFSVKGKREEKMEAIKYLYQLAEQNPQIQLLIRKHPSEKEEDLIKPITSLNNVIFVEYNASNSKKSCMINCQ
jgi:hypothetical protein